MSVTNNFSHQGLLAYTKLNSPNEYGALLQLEEIIIIDYAERVTPVERFCSDIEALA